MTENILALEEWCRLYDAALRLKEIAPWNWMAEEHIFGVQNPETDDFGFVSMIGKTGGHFGFALYLGAKGLYEFLDFHNSPTTSPIKLLEIPELQASFENRDTLTAEDRKIIRQLGLKFRGAYAWPMFRSCRPGFYPWPLEAAEARFLTHALEQALNVALRVKAGILLLDGQADERYLIRVPRREGETLVWNDQIVHVPPPELVPPDFHIPQQTLESLKTLPRSHYRIEADVVMLPASLQDKKGDRPYFAYLLLMVDSRSGMILDSDLLDATESLDKMWASVPVQVAHRLAQAQILPRELRVASPQLYEFLRPLANEAGIKIRQSSMLPELDAARSFLMQMYQRF